VKCEITEAFYLPAFWRSGFGGAKGVQLVCKQWRDLTNHRAYRPVEQT